MPHIDLKNNLPGIIGAMAYRPETAKPLRELAEVLLRGANSLSSGEREIIATHVSLLNDCKFCSSSHWAAAKHLLPEGALPAPRLGKGIDPSGFSPKLVALLGIAEKVRADSRTVSREQVEHAKGLGATDQEIHDTVLIAAAFCMYNRYVDGLSTWAPNELGEYDEMGKVLATQGYLH